MKEDKHVYNPYFLENKEFIKWRLMRTPELERYWASFIEENPNLKEEFDRAIEIFDKILINKKTFTGTDPLYNRIIESVANERRKNKRIVYFISSVAAAANLKRG